MAKVMKLANYNEIKVYVKNRKIEDEMIDQSLFSILEENAPFIDKKGPIEMGDTVGLSIQGYIDNQYIEEISIDHICIKVGSNSFGKGFDEQLLGMNTHQIKNIPMTYDSNYSVKELAGKTVIYQVLILEHFYKKEVEFTDEFVEMMEFNSIYTIQELINYVINQLKHEMKEEEEEDIRQQIIQYLISNSILEISEEDIEKKIDDEMNQTIEMFKKAEIEFDNILNLLKVDMNTYRKNMFSPCMVALQLELIYDEIARIEKIEYKNMDERDYYVDEILNKNILLIRN